MCNTPGFPLKNQPEIVVHRKAKKLCLQQNHTRVVQSSMDMLRSWRANCDIQLLIYDSPPKDFNLKEISRIVDYLIGYTCKGNTTLQEERQTNRDLILCMEETTGDNQDVRRAVTKIMNKASTRRLISKQESTVLLAGLKLTSSSENMTTISISNNKCISMTTPERKKSLLEKYKDRSYFYEKRSLKEYFFIDRQNRNLPFCIPHFVGVSGIPTFPVTEAYARHTLIIHKPWRNYPDKGHWINEFDKFIKDDNCPKSAKMTYYRVMQRYYNGTKFVDLIATKSQSSEQELSKEDEELLLLSGMHGKGDIDYDHYAIENIDKGINYKWDQQPKVSAMKLLYIQKTDSTTLCPNPFFGFS